MKKASNSPSKTMAVDAVRILEDKKAVNIITFDVRGMSAITDFYILATGNSPPHLKAMANDLHVRLKEHGSSSFRKAGDPESGWIVADYLDIIVHLLSPDARKYYALEDLWKDAPRLDI